jgi:hypothetical protein
LNTPTQLACAYIHAKRCVLNAGFGWEIIWQRTRRSDALTETLLLREAAWVILSTGMREAVVRYKFPVVSHAFLEWRSARQIAQQAERCKSRALPHFGHSAKLNAIVSVAQMISQRGFEVLKYEIQQDPLSVLCQFPYIGPVTSFHLAKNLGLSVAKADRHMSRIAHLFGYDDVQEFCSSISGFIGDPVEVVDIVLWRFATIAGSDYQGLAAVGLKRDS